MIWYRIFSKTCGLSMLLVLLLTHYVSAVIVCLLGPSSAGKSSIARELVQSIDCEYIEIDQIDVAIAQGLGIDIDDSKSWYERIHEIKEKIGKDYRTGEWKLDSLQTEALYDRITQAAESKKHVIIDACALVDQDIGFLYQLHRDHPLQNDHLPVVLIFVYCPLSVLAEHVIARNALQDLDQHREMRAPISSFCEYFKKRKQFSLIRSCGTLSRSEIDEVFALLKSLDNQQDVNYYNKKKRQLLMHFQFGPDDESVVIIPSQEHDFALNTSQLQPHECSEKIKAIIDDEYTQSNALAQRFHLLKRSGLK